MAVLSAVMFRRLRPLVNTVSLLLTLAAVAPGVVAPGVVAPGALAA